MNGLSGRVLRFPTKNPKNNKEILLLYGHHASIERLSGFVEMLAKYGNVTVPDLPGFGGMESFYKINEKPTFDTFADYLYSFVKLNYKKKKIIIVGMSFSVPVYVRMLQKYPQIEKNVEYCISLAGFVHHEDFKLPKKYTIPIKLLSKFFSKKVPAWFFEKFIIRDFIIKITYYFGSNKSKKVINPNKEKYKQIQNFEINLWKINDLRTRMYTQIEMFRVDLCNIQINSPIMHMSVTGDIYFNNKIVEQHLQVIFKNYRSCETSFDAHAPSVVVSAQELEPYIPKKISNLLKQLSKS